MSAMSTTAHVLLSFMRGNSCVAHGYQRALQSFAITSRQTTKQVLISVSHHYNAVSLFRMMSARSVVRASRNSHAEFIAKYFSRHDIGRINRHAESAMTPVLPNQGKVT
jgi:hypothetical protein